MNPNTDTETDIILRSVDQIYDTLQEKIRDVEDRKNRGALIIRVVEPVDDDKVVNSGDIIDVVDHNGKPKKAEVIYASQMMAYHPEFGVLPCVDILAEVIDPDRMTLDDFEDLYGEEDTQEETKALGPVCECGAVRSDCQQNQELFGVHINEDE